jgi:AcrR family transcriptional regulator
MASRASAGREDDTRPARWTLRDEQRRLTRQKLADAALELFGEVGYAAATAEGIARRAGATRTTFYLHYASKGDVVLELMRRVDSEIAEMFAALDALGDDASRADVRAWLEDAVSFWERHRALIEANEQALHVEHPVAEYWWGGFERAAEAMPRYLARWQGDDRARERVRIAALMMQLERVCYFWLIKGAPARREHVLDVLTDEWVALLARRS